MVPLKQDVKKKEVEETDSGNELGQVKVVGSPPPHEALRLGRFLSLESTRT